MVEISFSSLFKRAYKKRIKGNLDLEARFWQKVEEFALDPFDKSLKTHKLSGKLKDLWSFSVEYDEEFCFTSLMTGRLCLSTLAIMMKCIENISECF